MQNTLYGIKNCDTMKRAFAWLAERGVAYRFHDYKIKGIDANLLQRWCDRAGWEALLNTRGTTWRTLPAADRSDMNGAKAVALMSAQPSLVKRPVLEAGDYLLIGFVPADYEQVLK